jgi:hypothetical protein
METMIQTSIQFFWPLTEQIPLDLDYTDCDRPKLVYSDTTINGNTGLLFANTITTTGATWVCMEINPSKLTVDVENITFKQKEKPNLFRRIIYKIIGIYWEMR